MRNCKSGGSGCGRSIARSMERGPSIASSVAGMLVEMACTRVCKALIRQLREGPAPQKKPNHLTTESALSSTVNFTGLPSKKKT